MRVSTTGARMSSGRRPRPGDGPANNRRDGDGPANNESADNSPQLNGVGERERSGSRRGRRRVASLRGQGDRGQRGRQPTQVWTPTSVLCTLYSSVLCTL